MGSIFFWKNKDILESKSYKCGHCGKSLVSNQGYFATLKGAENRMELIYICHFCLKPTYFGIQGKQIPGYSFGNDVNDIPDEQVKSLYNEARNCTSCNAYTASVLCCRKLLMNIAVSKGADEGLKFIKYVEYLSNKGYVPPDGKEWVDHIRKKGNEATHEISIMGKEDSEELITFIEMLLKFIYEFPATLKRKIPKNTEAK